MRDASKTKAQLTEELEKERRQNMEYMNNVSICNSFIRLAEKTWSDIYYGEITEIRISEESITDYNLVELQKRHPNNIRTKKIPKKIEAKIGSDWEWWLGCKGKWLGLRVQAKRIDCHSLTYEHLDPPVNKYGRQIDLLISKSQETSPLMIPIYVFYNYWDINRFDPDWLCGTYPKKIESLGCGVSHALLVRDKLNQGTKKLTDIAKIMYPWNCLICCKGFARNFGYPDELPFRAFGFQQGLAMRKANDDIFRHYNNSDDFITDNPPQYVLKILKGADLSEEDYEQIDTSRITIINEHAYEV